MLFPVCDPGPTSSHPSVERYFAVVLNACGSPTMSASIMSARSRKFGGRSLIGDELAELLFGLGHVVQPIGGKPEQLPRGIPPRAPLIDEPFQAPLHLGVVGSVEPERGRLNRGKPFQNLSVQGSVASAS